MLSRATRVCCISCMYAEEGFSGISASGAQRIGPSTRYPEAVDGRADDGRYTFSVARLDSEGRCVITDHGVRLC